MVAEMTRADEALDMIDTRKLETYKWDQHDYIVLKNPPVRRAAETGRLVKGNTDDESDYVYRSYWYGNSSYTIVECPSRGEKR